MQMIKKRESSKLKTGDDYTDELKLIINSIEGDSNKKQKFTLKKSESRYKDNDPNDLHGTKKDKHIKKDLTKS